MALMVEVAELMEHFQWLTEAQSQQLDPDSQQAVAEELADQLQVDLFQAAQAKIIKNAQKYPAEKVRGLAKGCRTN